MINVAAIVDLGEKLRGTLCDSAFPHRYDHHVAWITPSGDDQADDARMIRWARDRAVYVNAIEDALEAGERPVPEA
jgi:hypothetical protein